MTVILDDDWQARETLTRMIRSWGLNAEGFAQPEHDLEHTGNAGCGMVLLNISHPLSAPWTWSCGQTTI